MPHLHPLVLSGALFALAAGLSHAQVADEPYPSRPVVLIVSTAAGGPNDNEVRNYLPKISSLLGQPFVMDFKAGAGTTLGAAYVAKARPDGQTLLVATASMTTFPALYKDLSFDIVKDFAPIVQMSERSNVLLVNPAFPVRNFSEYIAFARAHPGKVNFGTSGAGGAGHLAGAWLHGATATEVTFVPYKGTPPLMFDLVAGRVEASAAVLSGAMPLIRAGKVRPIAVMTATRSRMLPDLPTIAEQGVAGYNYSGWLGMVVPRGTPAAIISRLNENFIKVVRSPDIIAALESDGGIAVGSTPEQFGKIISAEAARWQKVVKDSAIVLDR